MSKKRVLGRGLDALIPVVENTAAGELEQLPVSRIRPNPRQPRQHLDEDKLNELAASIREHGVVQPVVVRRLNEGGFELIAGERRWRACVALGEEFIPAIIKDYDEAEASAISLIENIQRENLNPVEEAAAYRQLMDEFGLTQEELSRVVGKSRPFISNTLRLLSLPDSVKDLIFSGRISAGHARALLALNDSQQQVAAAEDIVAKGLTVREVEDLVRQQAGKNRTDTKTTRKNNSDDTRDADLESVEGMLAGILNCHVRIRRRSRNGQGVIEIKFTSRAHLDEIVNLIVQ